MSATVPNCSICDKPMSELPTRLAQTNQPIFACAAGKDPGKPCDGGLYAIATKKQ